MRLCAPFGSIVFWRVQTTTVSKKQHRVLKNEVQEGKHTNHYFCIVVYAKIRGSEVWKSNCCLMLVAIHKVSFGASRNCIEHNATIISSITKETDDLGTTHRGISLWFRRVFRGGTAISYIYIFLYTYKFIHIHNKISKCMHSIFIF